MQVMSSLPEPVMLEAIGSPPLHSAYTSFLSAKLLGSDWWFFGSDLKTVQSSFARRFLNFVIAFVMRGFVFPHFDKEYEALLPEAYKPFASERKRNPDLGLVLAVEGLYPAVPLPHNAKVVFPAFKQQLSPDEQRFSKELEWFYSLNERVVLVAFGSAMYPTNATMKVICELVQLKKDYAFLLAIKDAKRYFSPEVNDLLEQARQRPNVFITDWLPQPAVLAHNKTKLFITHGGANSFFEAVEAKVPLLVLPLEATDQAFTCEAVRLKGLGNCVFKPNSVAKLASAFEEIEQSGFYQARLEVLSRVVKKKSKQKEDLFYWIDYLFEVGAEHLQHKEY